MKPRHLALPLLLLICVSGFSQPNKDQLHALLILDIAKNSDFEVTRDQYTVSILGNSQVYDELVNHTRNIHIKGLPIKVVQTTNVQDIDNPQMIFITEDMSHDLAEVVRKTSGLPLIVVSEREDLFRSGADISFVQYDTHAFLVNVNQQALEKRNVKISKALHNIVHTAL